MSIITVSTQPVPIAARARRLAGPGRFCIEDDAEPLAAATTSAMAPVGMTSLLTMQEAEADAVQDRAARRHAGSMLAELSAVQRALLQDDAAGMDTALTHLSSLARSSDVAHDPRLAAVVQAIAMRAAVEAARRPQPAAHR